MPFLATTLDNADSLKARVQIETWCYPTWFLSGIKTQLVAVYKQTIKYNKQPVIGSFVLPEREHEKYNGSFCALKILQFTQVTTSGSISGVMRECNQYLWNPLMGRSYREYNN